MNPSYKCYLDQMLDQFHDQLSSQETVAVRRFLDLAADYNPSVGQVATSDMPVEPSCYRYAIAEDVYITDCIDKEMLYDHIADAVYYEMKVEDDSEDTEVHIDVDGFLSSLAESVDMDKTTLVNTILYSWHLERSDTIDSCAQRGELDYDDDLNAALSKCGLPSLVDLADTIEPAIEAGRQINQPPDPKRGPRR